MPSIKVYASIFPSYDRRLSRETRDIWTQSRESWHYKGFGI